jgi:hypothetical protein
MSRSQTHNSFLMSTVPLYSLHAHTRIHTNHTQHETQLCHHFVSKSLTHNSFLMSTVPLYSLFMHTHTRQPHTHESQLCHHFISKSHTHNSFLMSTVFSLHVPSIHTPQPSCIVRRSCNTNKHDCILQLYTKGK